MLEAGDLDFVRDEDGRNHSLSKSALGTVTISAPSIFSMMLASATATKEIKALFGDKSFDTAKPVD